MVRYLNPGGFDFGSRNLDGYGISFLVVAITYTVCFWAACVYLWTYRHHASVRMRNVPLLLLSLLLLHVFSFMSMIAYILNGAAPCQVEFWSMSIYFPIGIGLFQAQNQQLLIVSQRQAQLIVMDDVYKPFIPKTGRGLGNLRYWRFRLKLWWRSVKKERKFQAFIFAGFIIQFLVSFIIYNISRKFNHYGVVSQHTSPALCRRGWEWAPSIIWQFLWNYFFGPYLIWKIRLIRDIYHWRLQTMVAIIAGLPATPIWLAAVYSNKFGPVNRYWIPAMWFVPGIMTMQIVTLGFPIYQIFKHKRNARDRTRLLAEFDQKHLKFDDYATAGSTKTRSTTSKGGKMYSIESLDETLGTDHHSLQVYAACAELSGENIIFLTRVLAFNKACQQAFHDSCNLNSDFEGARMGMFRHGLSIYVNLVHANTAPYPINIESPIYSSLDAIFGPATALVAASKSSRNSSISTPTSANVTPWDDAKIGTESEEEASSGDENSYPMHAVRDGGLSTVQTNHPKNNESSEHIIGVSLGDNEVFAGGVYADPLQNVKVPTKFDERVFEAAFNSIRYMVWTGTWQRYQASRKAPVSPEA